MPPKLLTHKEAAAHLTVSTTTLSRYVQKGLIHAVRFGIGDNAKRRYEVEDLDRFIEDCKAGNHTAGAKAQEVLSR